MLAPANTLGRLPINTLPPNAPSPTTNEVDETSTSDNLKKRKSTFAYPDNENNKRRSLRREEKLEALKYKEDNKLSDYGAGRILGYNESQLRKWQVKVKEIEGAKSNSRRIGSCKRVKFEKMETELGAEWKEKEEKGEEITRGWFTRRGRELLMHHYPEVVGDDGEVDFWYVRFL